MGGPSLSVLQIYSEGQILSCSARKCIQTATVAEMLSSQEAILLVGEQILWAWTAQRHSCLRVCMSCFVLRVLCIVNGGVREASLGVGSLRGAREPLRPAALLCKGGGTTRMSRVESRQCCRWVPFHVCTESSWFVVTSRFCAFSYFVLAGTPPPDGILTVLAIAPPHRSGLYSTLAILEPRWWPCQIQVLRQKLISGGPGRWRQDGRCPPESAQFPAKNSHFSPKTALVRVQNSQTKANGCYTARAA